MTRLAVIGDIHANASALRASLDVVDARGFDRLIFIGDLLTYGVDVVETIGLVEARLEGGAVLLRGNHDAAYDALLAGSQDYLSGRPDWIRESFDWTMARLPSAAWRDLRFVDEFREHEILFSHANPFGAGQWDYLNSAEDHHRAAATVQSRGFRAGVFGHTHRLRWYRQERDEPGRFLDTREGALEASALHILNTGAIGQPRGGELSGPHVLWIETATAGHDPSICFQSVPFDTYSHLQSLRGAGLSPQTLAKISSFFVQSE